MEPERSLEQRVAAVESLLRTILARLEEIERGPSTTRPEARPTTATPSPPATPAQPPPPTVTPQPVTPAAAPPPPGDASLGHETRGDARGPARGPHPGGGRRARDPDRRRSLPRHRRRSRLDRGRGASGARLHGLDGAARGRALPLRAAWTDRCRRCRRRDSARLALRLAHLRDGRAGRHRDGAGPARGRDHRRCGRSHRRSLAVAVRRRARHPRRAGGARSRRQRHLDPRARVHGHRTGLRGCDPPLAALGLALDRSVPAHRTAGRVLGRGSRRPGAAALDARRSTGACSSSPGSGTSSAFPPRRCAPRPPRSSSSTQASRRRSAGI